MRIGFAHWFVAISLSVTAHGALMLSWPHARDGAASPPEGPAVSMSDSFAGVLGAPVAVDADEEAPREITEDVTMPLAAERVAPPTTPRSTAPEPLRRETIELAATAPIDPARELGVDPVLRSVPVEEQNIEHVIKPPPVNRDLRERKKDDEAARNQERTKRQSSERRGDGEKRAARKGNGKNGRTGGSRSGGGGSSKATAGQIASWKSQVRARIASCVRGRLGGGQHGTVTISFGVTSGGGASGVGVSGTPALASSAASAARGCSFPPPPKGASGTRFSFPATVK